MSILQCAVIPPLVAIPSEKKLYVLHSFIYPTKGRKIF